MGIGLLYAFASLGLALFVHYLSEKAKNTGKYTRESIVFVSSSWIFGFTAIVMVIHLMMRMPDYDLAPSPLVAIMAMPDTTGMLAHTALFAVTLAIVGWWLRQHRKAV